MLMANGDRTTTDLLSDLVARGMFTTLEEAWLSFLGHLEQRRGGDLRTTRRVDEIQGATRCIEEGILRREREGLLDGDFDWFEAFVRREDVENAATRFVSSFDRQTS
jgi:hypothetical protein